MGVIISTTRYAPLAFTSAIVGFVSFVFTLGTFLKVVWTNFETMSEAPHQVHGYLTNLRTELLEEKASIRIMRKQAKRYQRANNRRDGPSTDSMVGIELDDVTLKTMADSVRGLIKRFKRLEEPFLEPGADSITDWKDHQHRRRRGRGNSSVSPYYQHSAYASPPEKPHARGRSRDVAARREDEDEEDAYWAQRTQYASFTFNRRFVWLKRKSEAQALQVALSRVQIRRIARQVGGLSMLIHEYGSCSLEMQETVRRIDERMSRFVGVRRVD